MYLAIANLLLYLLAQYVYWNKYKSVDAYFVILSGYTFTAIMCACYMSSGQRMFLDTTILPYFYLFLIIMICLIPYRGFTIGRSFNISETKPIRILTWIYVIAGLIAFYFTVPTVIELVQSGEWGLLRQMLYADDDNIVLYNSPLEKLAKNIQQYLNPFGMIVFFYHLTKEKKDKLLLILLFIATIGNGLISATLVASRGMVVNFILSLLLLFAIFRERISHKIKRVVLVVGLILLIPVISYLIAVSVSRFGEEGAGSSIFFYLGHSMAVFNERVMGSMHDFAHGKVFFKFFIELLGGSAKFSHAALGLTSGTAFYTFVGTVYIDWGPIGTLLFAFFMTVFLNTFTRKRNKRLSDLIVIYFFADFYLRGIFVIGSGYALEWLMMFVVYFIVRFCERTGAKVAVHAN